MNQTITKGAFNKPTINTIMTLVVRVKETIRIEVEGQKLASFVEWSKTHAEPQVIEPNCEHARIYGIVDVIEWLSNVPEGSSFMIWRSGDEA